MIQNVMPKVPLRAIQYTGENADEIVEFTHGQADTYVRVMIRAGWDSEGDTVWDEVRKGDWIVEVPCTYAREKDVIYASMTSDYFREHYALCSQVIRMDESKLSPELLEQIKNVKLGPIVPGPIMPVEEEE